MPHSVAGQAAIHGLGSSREYGEFSLHPSDSEQECIDFYFDNNGVAAHAVQGPLLKDAILESDNWPTSGGTMGTGLFSR